MLILVMVKLNLRKKAKALLYVYPVVEESILKKTESVGRVFF